MSPLFPILAAVLQAASFTFDKVVLSLRHISFRTYLGISFPLIFAFELVIFVIVDPPLPQTFFSPRLVFLTGGLIFLTVIGNLLYYRALDRDRLSEVETFTLLTYIPTLIWAHFIFQDERNLTLLILALLASSIVVWSHWEHRHFRIARLTAPFFIWTVTFGPFGDIISREIIKSWNPIVMVMIRDGIVALIFGSLFFKYRTHLALRPFLLLLLTNLLTTVAWIIYYFSFKFSGIAYTILLFSLMPLLVYFASLFFLKETLHWKKLAAFIIVLVSIAIAQIFSPQ